MSQTKFAPGDRVKHKASGEIFVVLREENGLYVCANKDGKEVGHNPLVLQSAVVKVGMAWLGKDH